MDKKKSIEEENRRIYERSRDELTASQRSNSESYDKSILTLSSAGIGITITFISNIVDLDHANYKVLLFFCWGLFCLAIIITIISFMIGQRGIKRQLLINEQYYFDENAVQPDENKYTKWIDRINTFSGISFILAIVMLLSFVSINICGRKNTMSEEKRTITKEILLEGAPINNLQQKATSEENNMKTNSNNIEKKNIIGEENQRGLPINQPQPKPESPSTKPDNSTSEKISTNDNSGKQDLGKDAEK